MTDKMNKDKCINYNLSMMDKISKNELSKMDESELVNEYSLYIDMIQDQMKCSKEEALSVLKDIRNIIIKENEMK